MITNDDIFLKVAHLESEAERRAEEIAELRDSIRSLALWISELAESRAASNGQTKTVRPGTIPAKIISYFDTHPEVMSLRSSEIRKMFGIKQSAQSNKAMTTAANGSGGKLEVSVLGNAYKYEKFIFRKVPYSCGVTENEHVEGETKEENGIS